MCISTGWSSSRGSRRKDGRRLHLPNMPGKGQQDDQVSQGGHWKEGTRPQVPNLPGKSPATNIHVSSLPHHLLCMWSQGPKMSRVQGGTSNSPVEVIFFICPFLIFLLILWAPFFICPGTGMLRKLPWTWKTCCNNLWNWLEMIQRKKLKGHLVIIKFRILFPLMIIELSFDDDITKPIISQSHIFSLWTMCILQGRSLSLSLHRSQRSGTMASPSPTALSSTSCWSLVRGRRWWEGGGSSEISSLSIVSWGLFRRWVDKFS